MAPLDASSNRLSIRGLLFKRYCYDGYYGENGNDPYECNSSAWYDWGRWVLLAGLIVLAILVLFTFSLFNSRRRRRIGAQPMYGTGWLAGKPPVGHNQAQYNAGYYPNQPYNGGAAPPYQPPQQEFNGNGNHSNDGYYGQQSGVELQTPQSAYHPGPGQNAYGAPPGPPPAKH